MQKTHVARHFARGFPALLGQETWISDPLEPGLSLPLLLLLRSEGLPLDYAFVDVVSGHATQFLYAFDCPDCYELAFEPPVETLFKALHLTWQETTPSDATTAFLVMQDWLRESNKPVVARFTEPMLLFGVTTRRMEHIFHLARTRPNPTPEQVRVLDIELNYWRPPIDEGNELIRIIEKRPEAYSELELARTAIRRAIHNWHAGELGGCAVGEKAYLVFAQDLRDSTVDFTDLRASAWGCSPICQQWTARYSSCRFFERMAPRFGGKSRGALEKAAFYYRQCCEAWRGWDNQLGRPWKWWQSAKPENQSLLQDYYKRLRNAKRRAAGAAHVEAAMNWERKAITELAKVEI